MKNYLKDILKENILIKEFISNCNSKIKNKTSISDSNLEKILKKSLSESKLNEFYCVNRINNTNLNFLLSSKFLAIEETYEYALHNMNIIFNANYNKFDIREVRVSKKCYEKKYEKMMLEYIISSESIKVLLSAVGYLIKYETDIENKNSIDNYSINNDLIDVFPILNLVFSNKIISDELKDNLLDSILFNKKIEVEMCDFVLLNYDFKLNFNENCNINILKINKENVNEILKYKKNNI